jgi:glycosyltransferase involved in cell wall biosynthesis
MMFNLRIGIDASNVIAGGGVTHLTELLSAADPARHGFSKIVVWASPSTLAQLPDQPWLRKIAQANQITGSILQRSLWQLFCLSTAARREGCDILLIPGGSFFGSFRPFVTMSQNMLPFELEERARYGLGAKAFRLWLLSKTQYLTFLLSDAVISLSDHGKSVIERHPFLKPDKISVISHGVNPRFYRAPRAQRSISSFSKDDPMRILYVSPIEPYKHHAEVISAVAQLRQQYDWPLHLTLVGHASKSWRAKLDAVICSYSDGKDWISFKGLVPFSKVNSLMKEADLGIFASSCEACPNVVIEYMAAGLPIASSRKSPMPEVLGGGAVYFDAEHSPSIAATLAEFIRSPELRSNIAARAFDYAQKLTWGRCADLTFAFLNRTVPGRGNGHDVPIS